MKALKRKDYLDAIREIETEIRIAGTDGNQVGDEVFQVYVSLRVSNMLKCKCMGFFRH